MELDLINSEGGIIIAKKRDNQYHIRDEFGAKLAIFNLEALKLFLNGRITLIDSRRRDWNFLDVSPSMRATEENITELILA